MSWHTGRLPATAPVDLIEAIDIVRLDVKLSYADLRSIPQAVLDYLPMVSGTLADHRAREASRG